MIIETFFNFQMSNIKDSKFVEITKSSYIFIIKCIIMHHRFAA